jgi:putative FmdB family regulatory protein
MPLYDYDCAACGRRFEAIHGVHEDSPASCPLCGSGPVRKAISAPAFHFKGSGWAKKERRPVPSSTGSSTDGAESGSSPTEDAAAPAKSDAASSSPSTASKTTPSSTKTGD